MNLSPFLEAVPPWLRLIMAVALTVGFTLLALRLTHHRAMHLVQADKLSSRATGDWEPESGDVIPAPPSYELSGKVMGLTQAAFVFLLAFTLSNFWGNSQDARTAVMDENQAYSRAVALAEDLAPADARTTVLDALAAYRASVVGPELTAMRAGDASAAHAAHTEAVTALAVGLQRAAKQGAAQAPEWSALNSAAEDVAQDGTTRVAQVPGATAPNVVAMIVLLGLANLVLVVALLPTRRIPNYVLAGVLAGITGTLIFLLVEASNPYAGGPAVHIPMPLG